MRTFHTCITFLLLLSYFLEGGCFVPLILSTLPKKKALEIPTVALDFIADYFHTTLTKFGSSVGVEENVIVDILVATGNEKLDFLQILTDILKFKEERKVKKAKVKKGEPIPPPEPFFEDAAIVRVRNLALKCVYKIVMALTYTQPNEYVPLKKSFSNIDGFAVNMLDFIRAFLTDVSSHSDMQNACYLFSSLVFTLRYNENAVEAFIKESSVDAYIDSLEKLPDLSLNDSATFDSVTKSPILETLQRISKSEPLPLYCIQIQEIVCHNPKGLLLLSSETNMGFLINELERCYKSLHDIAEAAAAAAAAAANPKAAKDPPHAKKEEKGKKGGHVEPVHVEVKEELDVIKVEQKRNLACIVKLCSKIFTEIAQKNKDAIDVQTALRIGHIAGQLLVSHSLWEVVREPNGPPLDEPVFDVIEELSIMIGSIGFVSQSVRQALVESGCLQSLITVMQQSRPIISGVEELSPAKSAAAAAAAATHGTKGKAKHDAAPAAPVVQPAPELSDIQRTRLTNLRRVCEKAILNLSSDPVSERLSEGPKRWKSASTYVTDEHIFTPQTEGDAHKYSFFAELLDLVTYLNDDDLASRGVRMIGAVLLGSDRPPHFIRKLHLDHLIVTALTSFLKIRGSRLIEEIVSNVFSTSQDISDFDPMNGTKKVVGSNLN